MLAERLNKPTAKTPKPWPLGGYAPGDYVCKCLSCDRQFSGDKRATSCLECAVDYAADKIDGQQSELNGLVEAVAARSIGRRGKKGLYRYVAWNFPKLWSRFNGHPGYLRDSTMEVRRMTVDRISFQYGDEIETLTFTDKSVAKKACKIMREAGIDYTQWCEYVVSNLSDLDGIIAEMKTQPTEPNDG